MTKEAQMQDVGERRHRENRWRKAGRRITYDVSSAVYPDACPPSPDIRRDREQAGMSGQPITELERIANYFNYG